MLRKEEFHEPAESAGAGDAVDGRGQCLGRWILLVDGGDTAFVQLLWWMALRITWQVFPGRTQVLEGTADLAGGPWVELPGSEVVAGEADLTMSVEVDLEQSAGAGFYRVRMVE